VPERDEIATLLRSPDAALLKWYVSVTRPKDDHLILAGGRAPSTSRIGEIFDQWFERRWSDIRDLVCARLGYERTRARGREVGEAALVAIVASALMATHLAGQIDPLATAAILVSRRSLDNRCEDRDFPTESPSLDWS
jgi:hypothetical protein